MRAEVRRGRRGQATTEYLLLSAMLAIALLALAWALVPAYEQGLRRVAQMASGTLGGGAAVSGRR
jgi:hypothetical protein